MQTEAILHALFPNQLEYHIDNHVIEGTAHTSVGKVAIIGTVESAAINQAIAMRISVAILDIIKQGNKTPVVFIVDTQGQDLSRADELLCLNRTFAHLASCVELLRRSEHPNLAVIFGEAVSGGFLSYGLMANQVFALDTSQVKVMDLNAMSRVTKIPVDQLKSLSQTSAIFAPGVENFYKMGAIDRVWTAPTAKLIEESLAYQQQHITEFLSDNRRFVGAERQGRLLTNDIVQAVLSA